VEIEETSAVEKKVTVTIEQELVVMELDSAYNNLRKKAKIKGFRQGKAPRNILEKYYKDQVEGDVITKLVNDSYFKSLEENKIVPVSQPAIDNGGLEEGKEFTYSARVEVKPEIEVKGYIGMELKKEKIQITEEDIDNRISQLQQSNAQLQEVDEPRPIQVGDFAVLDYEGFFNEGPIEGEKVIDHLLELGSGSFPPEFEEQLLGLKKGDKKDIKITMPEKYHKADIAGKEVVFKLEIKGLKEKIISELNDDFAKDLGEFETLEELKKDVKENLGKRERLRIESVTREKILDNLVEENSFEPPPSMVDQHLQYLINEIQMRLSFQGLTMEQAGITIDSLKEKNREQAEKEVRGSLLLEEIAKKESIEADEKDIEARITEIAEKSGQEIQKIRDHYKENSVRERLRNGLVTEKALDFIVQKAKIEEIERGENDTDPNSS